MAINAFQNVTPGAKLALVNNKLGNPGLKKNQGSSSEIYDYIDVTSTIGQTQVLRFFSSVNTKSFPLTNLTNGNLLQVGEALAIEYVMFTRMEIKGGKMLSNTPLLTISALSLSQFSLLLDNSRIIKTNSLVRSLDTFNTKGSTAANYTFYPDTDLTIPPQISFTAELQIPANTDSAAADTTVYYGCHLLGTGAILNLKTNV